MDREKPDITFGKFARLCFFAVVVCNIAAAFLAVLVFKHPVWHVELVRFVGRAWLRFVSEQMGSTSPGFRNSITADIVGLLVLAIGIWYLRGADAVRKHAIETTAMGILGILVVVVLVYGTQFAWEIVQFVYDDHNVLAAKANIPKPICPTCPTSPPPKTGVSSNCRVLSTCPPSEIRDRAAGLASKIDRLYWDYMKAMDQISNESRANPNNTDPQVSQSYQTRARAAAVTAIQQYDGKYRQDALRYREELLLRVGPGLHDARMDGEYDPAVPFAQFLHDIALDLQTLASNLKEK